MGERRGERGEEREMILVEDSGGIGCDKKEGVVDLVEDGGDLGK